MLRLTAERRGHLGRVPGAPTGPESTITEDTGASYCRTKRRYGNAAGSRRGRDVVSDTIAWLLFSAAVVALILVSCILMTLGWPS